MLPRLRSLVFLGLLLGGLLLAGYSGYGQMPAPTAPLFEVGRTYLVVWDCTPEYMAQVVSQMVLGGQGVNPCYTEVLRIDQVRPDGWIVVTVDGRTWTVNAARMIGVSPVERESLRAGP